MIYANILSGMDHVLSSECYRQYKDNQVVCFFTEEDSWSQRSSNWKETQFQ